MSTRTFSHNAPHDRTPGRLAVVLVPLWSLLSSVGLLIILGFYLNMSIKLNELQQKNNHMNKMYNDLKMYNGFLSKLSSCGICILEHYEKVSMLAPVTEFAPEIGRHVAVKEFIRSGDITYTTYKVVPNGQPISPETASALAATLLKDPQVLGRHSETTPPSIGLRYTRGDDDLDLLFGPDESGNCNIYIYIYKNHKLVGAETSYVHNLYIKRMLSDLGT